MSFSPTDDTDVDPIEPSEEGADTESVDIEDDHLPSDGTPVPDPDLGEDIEEEIKRVLVVDEPNPKSKAQVVPDSLIYEELRPEDFFDEGSI